MVRPKLSVYFCLKSKKVEGATETEMIFLFHSATQQNLDQRIKKAIPIIADGILLQFRKLVPKIGKESKLRENGRIARTKHLTSYVIKSTLMNKQKVTNLFSEVVCIQQFHGFNRREKL